MSKKAVTKDSNNISSKLLGTNLADINIEKFRDVSQYNKPKYQISGKITIPLLKTITNKFAPGIMFTIVLPSHGLSSIEALCECQNLITLNLNRNSIQDLTPLQNLKNLKIVDLSDNSIPDISCFEGCRQLVNIHLEGNMIKSLDSIKSLQSCQKLKSVHLQTLSGELQNPICQLNNYRPSALSYLLQIRRLDGIPKDLEIPTGSELKAGKKKQLKVDIKNIGPFYTNKFPTTAAYTAPSFPGEQPLKKAISSCKSSINQLQIKLKAAMAM